MAATPLTPTLRYYPPGIRRIYWLPACANYLAPTRAELDAGTDLSAEVSALTGWSVTSATVDTPDMGSRFTSQIPGALTSASNDITVYTSSNSNDARTLLLRDTNGFVVLMWEGDFAGQRMDVFPVRVTAQAMDSAVANPGAVTISFAATRLPASNLVIPA
jgi:hypothetical protein